MAIIHLPVWAFAVVHLERTSKRPGRLRLSFVRYVATTTQLLFVVLEQMLCFPNLAIRDRHLQMHIVGEGSRWQYTAGRAAVVKIYLRCIYISSDPLFLLGWNSSQTLLLVLILVRCKRTNSFISCIYYCRQHSVLYRWLTSSNNNEGKCGMTVQSILSVKSRRKTATAKLPVIGNEYASSRRAHSWGCCFVWFWGCLQCVLGTTS